MERYQMDRKTPGHRAAPLDTTDDAHALQGDLYRRMSGEQRLATSFRLSADVRRAAMAGIQARHPDYSARELQQAYARLVLGDTLADAIWRDHPRRDP
jgi:hypothetical protein